MNSFAVEALSAQEMHGYAGPLSAPAANDQFKIEQGPDGVVYISQDGGAWMPLGGGGGGGTLNDAYLAGNIISVADAPGSVVFSSSQTSGTIFSIVTTTAPAAVTNSMRAINIDLSSLGTALLPSIYDLQAIRIVGAHSSAGKNKGRGLVSLLSSYRSAASLTILARNKSAVAGSIVSVGWDNTNYEGAAAASIIDAQTHVVTIDGQTNVDATTNDVEFIPLRIMSPQVNAVGDGRKSVSVRLEGHNSSVGLEFTDGILLNPSAANEGRFRYNATTQTFQVSMNGAAFVSLSTGSGGGTLDQAYDFGGAGAGRTITADAGSVVFTSAAADNNSLLTLTKNPAGVQTGSVFQINATPGVSAAIAGALVTMSTLATGAALTLTGNGQSPLFVGTTLKTSGTIFSVSTSGNPAPTGTWVGASFDFLNYQQSAQQHTGVFIRTPRQGSPTGSHALDIIAYQLEGAMVQLQMNAEPGNSPGVSGFVCFYNSNGSNNNMYLAYDLTSGNPNYYRAISTNPLTATSNLFRADITINGGAGFNSYVADLFVGNVNPTATNITNGSHQHNHKGYIFTSAPIFDNNGGASNYNVWGTYIVHTCAGVTGSGQLDNDNFRAHYFSISPRTSGGTTKNVKGISGLMGAGCGTSASAVEIDWRATAGLVAGQGIFRLFIGAATTFATGLTGFYLDLQNNANATTNNAGIIGLHILTPQVTASGAAVTSVSARFGGHNTSVGIEFTDGQALSASAASECRFRYNSTVQRPQTSSNTGAFFNLQPFARSITDTPYPVLTTDDSVFADCTAASIVANLPPATGTGRQITFKKTDATANTLTVDADGTDTIDGAGTNVILTQYTSITLQDAVAGKWWLI